MPDMARSCEHHGHCCSFNSKEPPNYCFHDHYGHWWTVLRILSSDSVVLMSWAGILVRYLERRLRRAEGDLRQLEVQLPSVWLCLFWIVKVVCGVTAVLSQAEDQDLLSRWGQVASQESKIVKGWEFPRFCHFQVVFHQLRTFPFFPVVFHHHFLRISIASTFFFPLHPWSVLGQPPAELHLRPGTTRRRWGAKGVWGAGLFLGAQSHSPTISLWVSSV